MKDGPGEITLEFTAVLDDLEIPYFIAGSIASIVHGMVRTTMAADIVAAIGVEHVSVIVDRLQGAFFVDDRSLRAAVAGRRQANVIHRQTMFKVDVYVLVQRYLEFSG